jgi:hypothetical protein
MTGNQVIKVLSLAALMVGVLTVAACGTTKQGGEPTHRTSPRDDDRRRRQQQPGKNPRRRAGPHAVPVQG